MPGLVDVVDGPCPERLRRVVVATFLGLGEPAVEVEKLDILVVPDAAEALEANARLAIPHAERARLYGFLEIGRHLAPYDADWMTAVFGVEEVVISRHGFIRRPVEVVAVKGRAGGQGVAGRIWTAWRLEPKGALAARAKEPSGSSRWPLERRGRCRPRAGGSTRSIPPSRPDSQAAAALLEGRGAGPRISSTPLAIAGRLPGWPIV